MTATARLEPDHGAAATSSEAFFRSPEFLEAERVTHTLIVEAGASRAAIPLLVREIPGAGDALDAISPYSYPGGEVSGEPIDSAAVDFSGTGLVSVFIRDRLGEPRALAGGTERSVVLVSDPDCKRKSRMSDRQQIRKNEAAGYRTERTRGPEAGGERRAGFSAVYAETMEMLEAADHYRFSDAYFELLLSSALSELFITYGPDGDVAAAAIAVVSDGFIHYYLSGTALDHRRRAPSKNLITAVTDYADGVGLPLNLGGGIRPGDGLEEFKRGFGNTELPFRTHEVVCDRALYSELSGDRIDEGFFPLYRSG